MDNSGRNCYLKKDQQTDIYLLFLQVHPPVPASIPVHDPKSRLATLVSEGKFVIERNYGSLDIDLNIQD